MRTFRPLLPTRPGLCSLVVAAAAGLSSLAACGQRAACDGAVAEECDAAAGLWSGTATTGSVSAPFVISVEASRCQMKGSLTLAQDLPAPLDGALCDATHAEIEFAAQAASGQGELDFTTDAVQGQVRLTVHAPATDFPQGPVDLVLSGAPFIAGGLDPACAGSCDDGNPCTDDSCGASSACVHLDNSAPCDDGDPCTVGEACAAGACAGGTPRTCDDTNPCTDDSCEAGTGACRNDPNVQSCDDGDPCTDGDACLASACTGTIISGCGGCGDGTCGAPEDCNSCALDCPGQATGPQAGRYCCGDGTADLAEGDGSVCDGNS